MMSIWEKLKEAFKAPFVISVIVFIPLFVVACYLHDRWFHRPDSQPILFRFEPKGSK